LAVDPTGVAVSEALHYTFVCESCQAAYTRTGLSGDLKPIPIASDPNLTANCPQCGHPLTYRNSGTGSWRKGTIDLTDQQVHLYFCEQDGFYSLWPDGTLKYTPSSDPPGDNQR
jgi:hypothetical protein